MAVIGVCKGFTFQDITFRNLIIGYYYFYRTRVRSLAMLVTHSLTD